MSSGKKTLGWILAAVFGVALFMGPGPGLALVNRPEPMFGVPAIYAWGLLWYVVEVGVVVVAYFFLWSREEPPAESTSKK